MDKKRAGVPLRMPRNRKKPRLERTERRETRHMLTVADILDEHIVPSGAIELIRSYSLPKMVIFSAADMFAAKLGDESVVLWGKTNLSMKNKLKNTKNISFSSATPISRRAFVQWGLGGVIPHRNEADIIAGRGVDTVVSNGERNAFAAKLRDGSVVTWGYAESGGDSRGVQSQLGRNVDTIVSSSRAFVALKKDGSVVTWGDSMYGGDSRHVYELLGNNVEAVYSTANAFAAKLKNGHVVTWGHREAWAGGGVEWGEDSSEVQEQLNDVYAIASTSGAFTALKPDGSIVTWGHNIRGGISSRRLHSQIRQGGGVKAIFNNQWAFAAKLKNHHIVTWGSATNGGSCKKVQQEINKKGVDTILSTRRAFAAKLLDGSVVAWGAAPDGGDIPADVKDDIKAGEGVDLLFSTDGAFAAKLNNGSVVTWGNPAYGGDSKSVQVQLGNNVNTIVSTLGAFAAKLNNGSVVTWGGSAYGGDSSSVQDKLAWYSGL